MAGDCWGLGLTLEAFQFGGFLVVDRVGDPQAGVAVQAVIECFQDGLRFLDLGEEVEEFDGRERRERDVRGARSHALERETGEGEQGEIARMISGGWHRCFWGCAAGECRPEAGGSAIEGFDADRLFEDLRCHGTLGVVGQRGGPVANATQEGQPPMRIAERDEFRGGGIGVFLGKM